MIKPLNQSDEAIQAITEALKLATAVPEWRNARVHARVEFVDGDGVVLLDRDGNPLQLDAAVCEEKIHMSHKALLDLQAHATELVKDAECLELVQRTFATINAETEQS